MEIILFNVLDFFHFRKELKKVMDLNLNKYVNLCFSNTYIFYIKNLNGTFALFRAIKKDDYYFYISDIYKLNNEFKSKNKFNYKNYKFMYNSSNQDDYPNKLGLRKTSSNDIMKIELSKFDVNADIFISHEFEKLEKNTNEQIRCDIQNKVFDCENRYPLKVKDIKYEFTKRCYIPELAFFIKNKFTYLGYGQILLIDKKYTVVNLCVKNEFQNKGFGTLLLKYLLFNAKKNGIKEIFIKVSSDNIQAKNIYNSIGFELVETNNTFEI